MDDQKFNVDALKILIGMSSDKITPNMISEAFNGQEAINEVKKRLKGSNSQNCLRVIFMDCNMPIIDGYQATVQILKLYE